MKEIGQVQSVQRGGEQVNGCSRSSGVRTCLKAWTAVTKPLSGLAPICSGWQPGRSH